MSLPQEDRSYILKLPNEVLSDVLSNVILTSPDRYRHQNKVSDSPFYAVRAVCRRFRAVVAELPLWCQPDFDILTLKPYDLTGDDSEFVQFLRSLCTDGDIVRTLQKRTHWRRIITIEMLETLMNGIPLFNKTVQSMQLYLRDQPDPSPSPFVHTMSLLRMCHCLTSLFLCFLGPDRFGEPPESRHSMNLDVLSQSLPTLEKLHIDWSLYLISGSVSIKHLREMHFQGGSAIERPANNAPNLLPIRSALTLQKLSLSRWPLVKGLYNHTALDCFVNVTFLDISVLNRQLCKLLMRFPGRLTTLRTGTESISWERSYEVCTTIAQVFSSPCLQNLKSLRFFLFFRMRAHHLDPHMIEPIIDKITQITTIQDLDLNLSLDLHWHTYFSRMVNLKRLNWRTEEHFDLDPTYQSLGIDMKEAVPIWLSYERPDKKVKIVFSKALENLPVTPELNFEIERMQCRSYSFLGGDSYDSEPDEDSDEYDEESDEWIESDDGDELDNDDI